MQGHRATGSSLFSNVLQVSVIKAAAMEFSGQTRGPEFAFQHIRPCTALVKTRLCVYHVYVATRTFEIQVKNFREGKKYFLEANETKIPSLSQKSS